MNAMKQPKRETGCSGKFFRSSRSFAAICALWSWIARLVQEPRAAVGTAQAPSPMGGLLYRRGAGRPYGVISISRRSGSKTLVSDSMAPPTGRDPTIGDVQPHVVDREVIDEYQALGLPGPAGDLGGRLRPAGGHYAVAAGEQSAGAPASIRLSGDQPFCALQSKFRRPIHFARWDYVARLDDRLPDHILRHAPPLEAVNAAAVAVGQ
jgi:hypothetical protein